MKKAVWHTGHLTDEESIESNTIANMAVLQSHETVGCNTYTVIPDSSDFGIEVNDSKAGFFHWSRSWEYAWITLNGNFSKDHVVMDAGGCASILPYRIAQLAKSVIICDKDDNDWYKRCDSHIKQLYGHNVTFNKTDLHNIDWYSDSFQRVVCASVLEHCNDPLSVIKELWRVTAPGGRLIVTMDVADYARYNHTIDDNIAKSMLNYFDMEIPVYPKEGVKGAGFTEDAPTEEDRPYVLLRVLGFYVDKNK